MPRTSRKIRFLGSLTKPLNKRLQQRAPRTINDDEDSLADAVDLSVARAAYKKNSQEGTSFENQNIEKELIDSCQTWKIRMRIIIRNDDSGDEIEKEAIHLSWLTEDEFLQKYRMSRVSFSRISRPD
jgi:hypothetical protein